jgi:anti-anti-sigma regulatory factor
MSWASSIPRLKPTSSVTSEPRPRSRPPSNAAKANPCASLREGGGVLHEILRLHYRDVVDDLWQDTIIADRLLVRGEIEASNVDRFDVVVRAAVTAGASTVDLSGVEFFSAAAVRALFGAADLLHQRDRPLVLLDPQVSHVKALALKFLAEHQPLS